ncbi:MAG: nucleoside hydrolase-like domain-containing protein [Bacteroidota bacterium]
MKYFFVALFCLIHTNLQAQEARPRVFVFTDINIDQGDPDDRQSLVHLLWYADELDIEGIVPDRWGAGGLEACNLALEAYQKDFRNTPLKDEGYPEPETLINKIANDRKHAEALFVEAASEEHNLLYVLIWGNMEIFGDILKRNPALSGNIRLITIGTHLMMEEYRQHIPESWEKTEKPCEQYNWNGFGRNEIFSDPRFTDMWWLEINWTYEGMFTGDEPKTMYQKLSDYGALGEHMLEVTKNQPWARYFRVGDTPSVLYVIDPGHDRDDPTESSWAGKFIKPFPEDRPNYYTDFNGPVAWDYENPCNTWDNHVKMRDYAKSTLEKERPAMYEALIKKLESLY